MQTLTVQITDEQALKALHTLEEKHFIRIIEKVKSGSPALPGKVMSIKSFRNWIGESEASPPVELKAAKSKWAQKRKLLQKGIK